MFLANSDLKLDVRTRCLSSSFLKNSTLYLRVLPNNLGPQGMLSSICKQEGRQLSSDTHAETAVERLKGEVRHLQVDWILILKRVGFSFSFLV